MSYILDALQRADAERARGTVPTLNARPLSSPATQQRLATPQRVGLGIAALVVALVGAALVWWNWGSAPPQTAVQQAVVYAAPAAVQDAPPVAVPPTAPAALTPPTANSPVVVKEPAPRPAQAKPSATASAAAPTAPAPASATAPAPASTSIATPVPLLAELPEATRRQIPALTISGAVYSENPAQRLLLVNGQVLNQGSEVAPDLKVLEIRSNSSEFVFRGTRFRVAH